MIRALLVDDSSRSLKTLRYLLTQFCPQVEIVGEVTSVEEAFTQYTLLRPNLLFLDIEMPRESGFDLLLKLKDYSQNFQVIFVTAFDHFALKAIKFCALDYILKPVDHQELIKAVIRAEELIKPQKADNQHYLQFLENIQTPNSHLHKIAMPTTNGYKFIPVNQIVRCEADGNYVRICLKNEPSFLATRRLKELEDVLDPEKFVRVHRSHVINLDFVEQFLRSEGGVVFMSDGTQISVARAHRAQLLKSLKIE